MYDLYLLISECVVYILQNRTVDVMILAPCTIGNVFVFSAQDEDNDCGKIIVSDSEINSGLTPVTVGCYGIVPGTFPVN